LANFRKVKGKTVKIERMELEKGILSQDRGAPVSQNLALREGNPRLKHKMRRPTSNYGGLLLSFDTGGRWSG